MSLIQSTVIAIDITNDVNAGGLIGGLARFARGGVYNIGLALVDNGQRTTAVDASTVTFELFAPGDVNYSEPLPATIERGEFVLNDKTNQYEAQLSLKGNIMSALSYRTLFGRISWDTGSSSIFHIAFNGVANVAAATIFYTNATQANQRELLEISNMSKPTTPVQAGEKTITIDIPAEYQTGVVAIIPQLKKISDASAAKVTIASKRQTATQLVVTLSAKCPADNVFEIEVIYLPIDNSN